MASVVLHRDPAPAASEPATDALAEDLLAGLPLVLLAPFPCDSRVWAGVRQRLVGDVITVDPPGFAGAAAEGEPSLEAYADAVAAELVAAGVDRYVVAGNSMGGYVALALADRHPAAVAGIGLLGTKATADPPDAKANRLAMAAAADGGASATELVGPMRDKLLSPGTLADDPSVVALLEAWLAEARTTGIAWAQRAMAARPDRTATLAALRDAGVPGLVLHGTEDPLMGVEVQEPMARALGVEVTRVPGRGHLLPLKAPDETAAALGQLWERARG